LETSRTNIVRKNSLFFEDEKDYTVQCMCTKYVMFLPSVQNDNSLLREAVRG